MGLAEAFASLQRDGAAGNAGAQGEEKAMPFSVMLPIWAAVGIGYSLLFYVRRDVHFKEKYHPRYMVFIGVVFFTFVLSQKADNPLIYIFALFGVLLITYLNIRNTRFCGNCTRPICSFLWFGRVVTCRHCGAKTQF